MAFGKRFHSTYYSSNEDEYTLDIYCDGFGGSSTAMTLGSTGCVINYESDGDEKFTPVMASSMSIPIIVENATIRTFITELRESYEEREVYVHLYNDADSGSPMWSGFVLMDLASSQDISMPYEVNIKAVDGIGLLKDVDWVIDGSSEPYELSETYAESYQRITLWLQRILEKTGAALTTQGASSNYTYQTSVNWYNDKHAAVGQTYDPLHLTQCKMDGLYKVDDELVYTAPSTYDVLVAICKSWGMRCVYWNHIFFFTQIGEYDTEESGTLANPVNIATREYYYTGSLKSTQAFIGTDVLSRYELDFENGAGSSGLQKLAGSQYGHYPIIKKVETNYRIYEDVNAFRGFPLLKSTTPSTTYEGTVTLGSFWDMDDKLGWLAVFPVRLFTPQTSTTPGLTNYPYLFRTLFSIRAKASGGSFTKMLTETNGVLSWQAYSAPTTSDDGGMIYNVIQSAAGISGDVNVFDSTQYINGIIPTDAAFTGKWEFEIYTWEYFDSGGTPEYPFHGGHALVLMGVGAFNNPRTFGANYNNISNYSPSQMIPINHLIVSLNTGAFEGTFSPVTTNVIGASVHYITALTAATNSYVLKLDNLFWGDSSEIDIPSTLRIASGASWVYPDAAGDWGVGTISGNQAFVELLCEEIISNQTSTSLKLNGASALSVTNKEESGYLKFLNPISKLIDLDDKPYIMIKGSYTTGTDQWQGEWFEFQYTSTTPTFVSNEIKGKNSGNIVGGGSAAANVGFNP